MNQQVNNPTEIWITLGGQVNAEMAQRIFASMTHGAHNGIKKIHLLIHSSGGFIADGIGIYNYLRNLPIEIHTYNVGQVSSIAVLIFLAGKQRFASQAAFFMIHKSQINAAQSTKASELRYVSDALLREDARVEAILKGHITMPKRLWVAHRNRDLNLTSEEALSFGLINSIHDFAPPAPHLLYNI